MELKPIETAPKDGTDILVFGCVATVWIAHIAWWRSKNDIRMNPDFTEEDVGWWSYTQGSVSQELLDGFKEPALWCELPQLPDGGV